MINTAFAFGVLNEFKKEIESVLHLEVIVHPDLWREDHPLAADECENLSGFEQLMSEAQLSSQIAGRFAVAYPGQVKLLLEATGLAPIPPSKLNEKDREAIFKVTRGFRYLSRKEMERLDQAKDAQRLVRCPMKPLELQRCSVAAGVAQGTLCALRITQERVSPRRVIGSLTLLLSPEFELQKEALEPGAKAES